MKRFLGSLGAALLTIGVLALTGALSASAQDPYDSGADLSVKKSDSADPATVGVPFTYRVTVTNEGPATATGVELTDTLPSSVDFVSLATSKGICERKGKKITCDLGSITAYTETVTVDIRVVANRDRAIVNRAIVISTSADPNTANNSASERTEVVAGAPGLSCRGEAATHVGTNGNDSLVGTDQRDVFVTFAGNDVIDGLKGDDLACGGPGDDLMFGRAGKEMLRGAGGEDTLKGGRNDDSLHGGGGEDTLKGGGGKDSLRGGGDDDKLKGGGDDDSLRGGRGGDTLKGGGGKDSLRGGPGNDRCRGGRGRDSKRNC